METSSKLSEFEKRLNSLKAKDMMTKSVISVRKDMSLADFSEMILTKRISGATVMDDSGKVVGIITATDLFMLMYMLKSGDVEENGRHGVCNPTVDFAMSREVITVNEATALSEIITIMREHNIHTLPVMEGGKLVGVIGRRDITKHFYSIVKEIFGTQGHC